MLIVANWKAYVEDLAKAKKLFADSKRFATRSGCRLVVAPPAPLLGALHRKNASPVEFAAQDISVTTGGAATGEVTAQAFAAVGTAYALVGHPERRARGDTDLIIAEKLAHALAHGLTPILCVGESERDSEGRYLSFVREQLTSVLSTVAPKTRKDIVIAYEPIWAVGKAAAIDADDLREMILYIRKVLAELLPGKTSRNSRILYGGAVESGNVRALAAVSGVDGFLIGRASVDPRAFGELLKQLS